MASKEANYCAADIRVIWGVVQRKNITRKKISATFGLRDETKRIPSLDSIIIGETYPAKTKNDMESAGLDFECHEKRTVKIRCLSDRTSTYIYVLLYYWAREAGRLTVFFSALAALSAGLPEEPFDLWSVL